MATQKSIRRRMLDQHADLGMVEAITALGAQTVTTPSLGGGVSNQKWMHKHLVRADAATSADRYRWGTGFNGTSGQFTHPGTAYSDTTVGTEYLEIHENHPSVMDQAIQVALSQAVYRDIETVLVRNYTDVMNLGDLDWITSPEDILGVFWSENPVLSRDRYFEKWDQVSSAGVLGMRHWALIGSGATLARSTDRYWQRAHVLKLTRNGTDASALQTVPVYRNGVDGYDLRGKSLTFVAQVWGNSTGTKKITIDDSTTSATDTHTGSGEWEELTAAITVAAGADNLSIYPSMEDEDASLYCGEAYLVETDHLSDMVRRGVYPRTTIPYTVTQTGPMQIKTDAPVSQGRLEVETQRSYPQFDYARVKAGTADADVTDAPELLIAIGAIAQLYRGKGDGAYTYWAKQFETMQKQHLAMGEEARKNTPLPPSWAPPARMIR